MKRIWYYLWKVFLKTNLHFYAKKIIVTGTKNIPKKGAVLFMVNHPNGLLDPLLVTTHLPRVNHYLVRAAVFKKPLVKKLLGTLNLMPIYRIRDGASELGKNHEIFQNCFDIFRKGQTLMIFPEGSHNRKRTIRPLSKGFTRIVFGALKKYEDLKITIVPVGLTYQNASHYPAKVAIQYGSPILANDFYNPDNLNKAIVLLKKEVSEQLKQLSVHIPNDAYYKKTLTGLNNANLDFTEVSKVNAIVQEKKLPNVCKSVKNRFKLLKYFIVLNSIFPFMIWKIVAQKIDEIEFVDTFRFGINVITFPTFYALQTWLFYFFLGYRVAFLYFFISIMSVFMYSKCAPTPTENKINLS